MRHLGVRTDDLSVLLQHMGGARLAYRHGKDEEGWRYATCETPDGLLLLVFENERGFGAP